MKPTEEVLRLRKLSQQYAYISIQMHESIGRKIGLAGTDHKYLGFLVQKGPLSAGELSVLTGLTTGAVTGLIDRFEKRKLVKRQPDDHDRRKIIIVPDVDKILKLITPFYRDFQDDTDRIFGSFSPRELKTLEKYFLSALAVMNKKIENISKKP